MNYVITYKDKSQAYSDRLMIEADSEQEAEEIFWQANGDKESAVIINIMKKL